METTKKTATTPVNEINAFRLAKMNGIALSMDGFERFLSEARRYGMRYAQNTMEMLNLFMESQPIVDFQLKRFDIPWVIRLASRLADKANSIKENSFLLKAQENALRVWVDYIIYNHGFDPTEFGFEEAKGVYYAYLDSRASVVSTVAA